jgi:hypothetical protein
MHYLSALKEKYPLPPGFAWERNERVFLVGIVDTAKKVEPNALSFRIWAYHKTTADGYTYQIMSYSKRLDVVQSSTEDDALNVVYTRFLLGDY